jgi:hypothetical protein
LLLHELHNPLKKHPASSCSPALLLLRLLLLQASIQAPKPNPNPTTPADDIRRIRILALSTKKQTTFSSSSSSSSSSPLCSLAAAHGQGSGLINSTNILELKQKFSKKSEKNRHMIAYSITASFLLQFIKPQNKMEIVDSCASQQERKKERKNKEYEDADVVVVDLSL